MTSLRVFYYISNGISAVMAHDKTWRWRTQRRGVALVGGEFVNVFTSSTGPDYILTVWTFYHIRCAVGGAWRRLAAWRRPYFTPHTTPVTALNGGVPATGGGDCLPPPPPRM